MTKLQAVTYYRTVRNLARALGLRENSVSQMVEVPPIHQIRLESLTAGYLRADDEAWHPAQPRISRAAHKNIVRQLDAIRKAT